MKLESLSVRVHPHAAMGQIREAVRPKVRRSQRRWKRRARMRRLALRAETVLLWMVGLSGVVLAACFVASEAWQLASYLVERGW